MDKIEIEDKIKSLARKRDEKVLELDKLQKKLLVLMEEYYQVDDTMIQTECISCGGVGYGKSEQGDKKVICQICLGKCYNWMRKYSGKREE